MPGESPSSSARVIGRYRIYDEIASGGMATVSFGRLLGPVGFARTVAIKELHAQFAKDPEFVAMFLDEARLAARIHHPNVVATLDVVAERGQLVLVMDYVHGESLAKLMRASKALIPPKISATIIAGALHGLHSAHEARSERGQPLGIVHRDISPQNILVGTDGVSRVLDFGVAKAANRLQTTQEGHLKGKLRYMSPEQVAGLAVDRQTDIYAMAVVLFEMVTGRALFPKGEPASTVHEILYGKFPRPSEVTPGVPPSLDAIVMRGLARDRANRFQSALEMALALEEQIGLASSTQVAGWVHSLVQDTLALRAATVSAIESSSVNEPIPVQVSPSYPELAPYAQQPEALPTGNTVVLGASPPASHRTGMALALAGFGLLALMGAVLMVLVFRRPATATAAPSAPPPPATSVIAASEEHGPPPEPTPDLTTTPVAPVAPTPSPPASAPASASVKKPAAPPPPAPPPVARPKPKEDDMARSRR